MRRKPKRKTFRRYHQAGDLHELTFSCYGQMPLLANDDWKGRLARHIDRANNEESISLVAFVFMPEHLHLLVYPTLADPRLDRYLARIKQPFSKEIKELATAQRSPLLEKLMVQERPGKRCFRFWQAGPGFDRNLYTCKAIEASIDYLHLNPVRRGFCQRAVDWKWSSARFYLGESPLRDPDLPRIHGIPEGTFDGHSIPR